MQSCLTQRNHTWDLKEEVVRYRVAGASFLNNNIGQEVIVVDGNGSMVIDYQRWPCVWYLLHPMNLIAWYSYIWHTQIPLKACSSSTMNLGCDKNCIFTASVNLLKDNDPKTVNIKTRI